MNVRWMRRAVLLLAFFELAGSAVGAAAHEGQERVPLDWKRDAKAVARVAPAPAPPPELPAEIMSARPAGAPVTGGNGLSSSCANALLRFRHS